MAHARNSASRTRARSRRRAAPSTGGRWRQRESNTSAESAGRRTGCSDATGFPARVIVIGSPFAARSTTSPAFLRSSRIVTLTIGPKYHAGYARDSSRSQRPRAPSSIPAFGLRQQIGAGALAHRRTVRGQPVSRRSRPRSPSAAAHRRRSGLMPCSAKTRSSLNCAGVRGSLRRSACSSARVSPAPRPASSCRLEGWLAGAVWSLRCHGYPHFQQIGPSATPMAARSNAAAHDSSPQTPRSEIYGRRRGGFRRPARRKARA